jgi:methylenetetrahydrofolate dehydrogenase (NADP+)/methenyltetrahydrofolate cyclohydrolase
MAAPTIFNTDWKIPMSTAAILNGADVVKAMNAQTAEEAAWLREQGIEPVLTVVRVGEREDAIAYETGAFKRCEVVGISTRSIVLPQTVTEEELIRVITDLNTDDAVHGVLLLRPLPAHIDDYRVRNTLAASKDIDGITDTSTASVFTGASTGFSPCTPQACIEILDHYGFNLSGKRVVVIGRSLVIGRPVAMMLLQRDATVSVCHSRSTDLPRIVREADIVVVCIGRAKMIDASFLREGQVVIDVGINFSEEGKMVGDVDFDSASSVVSALTPVPGGVGAVTTSVLVKHVVEAAKKRLG